MRVGIVIAAVAAVFSSSIQAQVKPAPAPVPFWNDTIGESPIYPVGDAIPVYRAVLDLIYLDGTRRPSVIIMLDSTEGHMGGPCPFDKCPGREAWLHKSRIDPATAMAYARQTRKRPGIRSFGYPIPIVFISQDDVRRMDADGRELIASHPKQPDLPNRTWGFWAELQRKYPEAWGVISLTKVGFNKRHTEALVQAHEWCGDDCRVHETLFLRQTGGRWRVVERIPEEADAGYSPFGRYLGPAGRIPKESEIVPADRPGVPTEATARADVYRVVVDSLYSVNGERPKRIVLTNWSWSWGDIPAHKSAIDPALAKRFSVLGAIRAPLDVITRYRVPVSTLPVDSVAVLRERGAALDVEQTGFPFSIAFAKKYPGAWGRLGLSRIAFNPGRSQALVNTFHSCGNSCVSRDTWFVTRSGKTWRIAERIPVENQSAIELDALRYVGVDVGANTYRPRRVQGVVTDEVTGQPLPRVAIRIRRVLNTGVNVDDSPIRADSAGHYVLTNLPLNSQMALMVPCPHQPNMAGLQALTVTPGLDTTINLPVNYALCDTTVVAAPEPPPAPNPLSGAEAFISKDSARFVFPRQPTETYEWDVPMKGTYAGSAEYTWQVDWEIPDSTVGEIPYLLWLSKRWTPGGPRHGSLRQLIAGVRLDPMIECTTCDGAVYADTDTDHSKVFATVEGGRLVFVIRGAEAVRRIFPKTPTTVSFSQTVRHGPRAEYGPGDITSSQKVLVNCRNSNESAETRHHCDVRH